MDYPKNWKKVSCFDWCEEENKIWMCLENKNAICELDKKGKKTKILGSFPHNDFGEAELSLSVKRIGDYIIFCPFKANDIAILNVSTEELSFIDLSQILNKRIQSGIEKFYRMTVYKEYVYFFGIKYPAIMRFNLISRKIDLFDDWLDEIEKHKCKEAVLFTDGCIRKQNEIYIPIGKCSGMLKVNLDTMKWEYIKINLKLRGILGMTQKDNHVWFTEHDVNAKYFFQWNLNSDEIVKINLPSQDAFYAPLYYNKSLFFFKNLREKNYLYQLESGEWKDITTEMPNMGYSSDKKVREKEIDYFSDGRFYHWNPKMKSSYYDEFQIHDKDFLQRSWIDYCERNKKELEKHFIKEGRLSISDYIGIINTI